MVDAPRQGRGLKEVNALLIEPYNSRRPEERSAHNGALGPLYLAAALRDAGYHADYLDATIGTPDQSLEDTFYNRRADNDGYGLVTYGMTASQVADATEPYSLVGISNIFAPQSPNTVDIIREVRKKDPEKFIIAGGVNPRSLPDMFLDAGANAVCAGEGEGLVVDVANALSAGKPWQEIGGLIYRTDGRNKFTGPREIIHNADDFPIPAYALLDLAKYWEISIPHGGTFKPGEEIRHGPAEFARGCMFRCSFCHVGLEKPGGPFGHLSEWRAKSIQRALSEAQILKDLGVQWIFMEGDSELADPRRAAKLMRELRGLDLKLADVNGVNLVSLFRKESNKWELNYDLLDAMAEAGMKELVLPFESGSKRIIDRWATGKWDPENMNVALLVREAKRRKMVVPGNFMFGFPDETPEEVGKTLGLAERLVDQGLDGASLFIVTPYPGSPLWDYAIRNNLMDPNINLKQLSWANPVMDTVIPKEELIRIRFEERPRINGRQGPDFEEMKKSISVGPGRDD